MSSSSDDAVLRHTLRDGATAHLLRAGPVAAQLLLTPAPQPRLLVAFAAGNSGAAAWFDPVDGHDASAEWALEGPTEPVHQHDGHGRPLHGLKCCLSLDVPALHLRRALVGSVRMLRDHQFDGRLPDEPGLVIPPAVQAGVACWARDRLDGAPGYALTLATQGGTRLEADGEGGLRFIAAAGQPLRLVLTALTGEPPLTPVPASALLDASAADLPDARRCLEFLAFEEKWLAGSWRFHTYFGRDTLMSARLLMPALRPAAAEAALDSVLQRLSPAGEVAHEEDIGEHAVAHHRRHGASGDAPVHDYKMVDDDFMLLPVLEHYLLRTRGGRQRAAAWLASGGRAAAIVRNLGFVLQAARPFADAPEARHLVPLKAGEIVGDWRDSADGLGGGRFAYSVNAALVPAALRSAQALLDSGLLDGATAALDPALVSALPRMLTVWQAQAPLCFEVAVDAEVAGQGWATAAARYGMAAPAAPGAPVTMHALALDDDGRPVAVQHSDFGFSLLLDDTAPERIARELAPLMQPFPRGLMTGVGMLVANASLAPAALQPLFGHDRYHGEVVWSWQQALMAAGIARQLARADLPEPVRGLLREARQRLWAAIDATRERANSELWSWRHGPGHQDELLAFGPLCVTADESNAAQLWSTVYLAVQAQRP